MRPEESMQVAVADYLRWQYPAIKFTIWDGVKRSERVGYLPPKEGYGYLVCRSFEEAQRVIDFQCGKK